MTINADFNGRYLGSLLFGSVIGLLIVVPLTGAMYRINDTQVQAVLVTSGQGLVPPPRAAMQIISLQDVPANLRSQLESVSAKYG